MPNRPTIERLKLGETGRIMFESQSTKSPAGILRANEVTVGDGTDAIIVVVIFIA